jgi:hypothetical protein
MTPPDDLRQLVRVPGDVDAVADLAYGRLNSKVHLCGHRTPFPVPLVVVDEQRRVVAAAPALPADDVRRQDELGYTVIGAADQAALRSIVLGWLAERSFAFWPTLLDRSYFALDPRSAIEAFDPLQILAVTLARDGILVPILRVDGDGRDRARARRRPARLRDRRGRRLLGHR